MATLGFLILMTSHRTCSGQQTCAQDRNVIGLDNGGYTDLLVAIQKDVEEDVNIIDQLKVTITTNFLLF